MILKIKEQQEESEAPVELALEQEGNGKSVFLCAYHNNERKVIGAINTRGRLDLFIGEKLAEFGFETETNSRIKTT